MHVEDMLAAILSRGIAQQLKQGLYRTYIEHNGVPYLMYGIQMRLADGLPAIPTHPELLQLAHLIVWQRKTLPPEKSLHNSRHTITSNRLI